MRPRTLSCDEEVAQAGAECDAHFDRSQSGLIAGLRRDGVSAELPRMLEEALRFYWQKRCALLVQYRRLARTGDP